MSFGPSVHGPTGQTCILCLQKKEIDIVDRFPGFHILPYEIYLTAFGPENMLLFPFTFMILMDMGTPKDRTRSESHRSPRKIGRARQFDGQPVPASAQQKARSGTNHPEPS